ncbi:unnamed protein product [Rangifer tarandus platyrhynchus]|uniref:Uncharacterized protein n=1 Tax=Rangifer tarandus platyrhynchus TaxID=3082113 RepID=A0ACB1KE58_RANTA
MGTARREIYTLSPGFSRASESSPDAAGTATLSKARAPLSGRTHSRAPCPSQRKENSPRGSRRLLRDRLHLHLRRLHPGPRPRLQGSPQRPSYSSRLHHLSGPNTCAHAPPPRRGGRDGPVVRPRRTGEASGSHLGRRLRRPSPSLRHGGFLLFNFPLRYLLTIGLVPVFSLRWSLPPALGCIPKQPDSGKTRARRAGGRYRPHTVHGLGLDQKDLGPPRAAPGSRVSEGARARTRGEGAREEGPEKGTERPAADRPGRPPSPTHAAPYHAPHSGQPVVPQGGGGGGRRRAAAGGEGDTEARRGGSTSRRSRDGRGGGAGEVDGGGGGGGLGHARTPEAQTGDGRTARPLVPSRPHRRHRPRPRGRGARAAARPQPGGRARSGGQTPRRPAGRRRGTRPRGADAHTGSASGASRPPRQGESHGGRPGSGHGPRTRGRGRKAPQRRGGGGGGGAGPAGRRGNTARQGQGSERRRTGDATPHTPPNQPRGAPQPRHEARDRPQPPTTPQGPTPPEGRLRREGALEGGKDTDHGRPVASARAQIPFSPPHRRGTPPATEAGGTPRPGGSHPPPGRRAGGRAHAPHTATAHTTTAGYLERGRRARGTARPTGHRPDVGHQPPHPPHTRGRPRASALPARGARGPHRAPVRPRPGGSPRRRQATNPPTHPPETGQSPPRPPPQLAHPHGRPPPRDPARSSGRPATGPRQTSPGPAAAGGDGARRAAPHDGEPPTRHAAQPATRDRRTRTLRSAAGGGRKAAVAGATGEGSPTETLLRLLLPLDSQVRPSSQRSARAVGRPRRGRSEGLTKPSNRHSDYHRKLIGQTFEWVVAATGGVRSARGYLESPKPPAPAPRPGPGGG